MKYNGAATQWDVNEAVTLMYDRRFDSLQLHQTLKGYNG